MDALQRKQRGLYASARDALSEWESVQSALASLVGTACNILPRLRLLAQDGAFAGLDAGHMLPELCRRKQMAALDSVLRSAHEQLAALTAVVHRLEKLAADGSALLQARPLFAVSRLQLTLAPQGLRPPPAQGGGVRHGGEPSLADGVEGLEDLWRMCRDELALKALLVASITPSTPEQDLASVQALLGAEPNMRRGRRDELLTRVLSDA